MSEDEKDTVVEAARYLMLEAMTMEDEVGAEATVAALLSCAASLAVEGGVTPKTFARMALASFEMTFPEACDADEDWQP